jgi:MoaA/NifB/PqqE/SkfB family radical SAM enzyme
LAAELTYRRAPLRAPFNVCLWLTDTCNLACKYCYAMPFSGRRMDGARVLRLIDELADAGVFDLTLAGGEPLLHPQILDIVDRAAGRGLRVGLLTNATRLDLETARELERRTSERNFIVQVSIDSLDPAVNDSVRGRTELVVENLLALATTSIQVQVACVLSKANVATAHLLIDQLYPAIKRFHFLNVQRTEQALKHPHLLLDDEECEAFWLRLAEHSRKFPPDLFLPSLRVQMRARGGADVTPEFNVHEQATFACASCSAGWTHINVTSTFDMLGCDIAKDHTVMGNLRDRTFEEVWHSEQAHAVRNAEVPACYFIQAPDGSSQADTLKREFAQHVAR